MTNGDFIGFVALSVVLSLTPGPDTMLVLGNTLGGGFKNGFATTIGVKAGTLTHSILAAVGVAAVLVQFAYFYSVMKFVGAAYLIGLGLYSVYKSLGGRLSKSPERTTHETKPFGRCFVEGFLSNILNPKVVIFYVAVLPQFVEPGDPVFLTTAKLASVHVGVSFVWLLCVSAFVGFARTWLTNPSVRRAIGAASGLAIAAFGVRLALSQK